METSAKKHINKKRGSIISVLPMAIFTVFFIIIPFIYLLYLSFTSKATGAFPSAENYKRVFEPVYRKIFKDSITIGLLSTVIVTLIGYPFGYFMAKLTPPWQHKINYILLIPFMVSSVLRLYGWDIILRADGVINNLLLFLKIIEAPLKIKYTYGATLVGIVYALLPFMIFAVYSSAEKLDWSLIEASRDLGASSFQTFKNITIPLTLPGLLTGVILTFIPSMGLMFISEILGGGTVELVGNLIVQEAVQAKNLPFAAAVSAILMIVTSLFIWGYRKLFNIDELEGLV